MCPPIYFFDYLILKKFTWVIDQSSEEVAMRDGLVRI